MTSPFDRDLLLQAVAIAAQARANGNHPFDDESNLTLELPCRTVFAAGRRQITVRGPFELDEAREVHAGFWRAG